MSKYRPKVLPRWRQQACRRPESSGDLLQVVLGGLLAVSGCAEIITRTETRLHRDPAREAVEATVAGSAGDDAGRRITSRQYGAKWRQQGAQLDIWLTQSRTCQVVYQVPIIRETRTIRTADAALYWEYGMAIVAGGLGVAALASPKTFSAAAIDETGQLYRDASAGYTFGGLFAGIGAIALIAAIHDTVQTRDSIETEETFVLRDGPTTTCEPPKAPASGLAVTFVLGSLRLAGSTDAAGHLQLQLPPEVDAAAGGATDQQNGSEGPRKAPKVDRRVLHGSVRIGQFDAVAIDVLVPFALSREQARVLEALPPSQQPRR